MKKALFAYLFMVLLILGTTNLVFAIGSLDKITVKSPRLVNSFGEPVSDHINLNQQVQVAADIVNNQEEVQPFIYIVQVKNRDNVILSISWITGSLNPDQSFSPALSWAPQQSGSYKAEIYVWKSMAEPEALVEKTIINIIAS